MYRTVLWILLAVTVLLNGLTAEAFPKGENVSGNR